MNTKTKKTKRGFTITELVIVIAVIAILAAVLIPTFSNVIKRANESAAMQEARSEYDNFSPEVVLDDSYGNDFLLVYKENDADAVKYFVVVDGQFNPDAASLSGTTVTYTEDGASKTATKEDAVTGYTIQNSNITIYKLTVA